MRKLNLNVSGFPIPGQARNEKSGLGGNGGLLKYGEMVPTQFSWVSPTEQMRIVEKLERPVGEMKN
jgi:hypothetical protein